MPTMAAGINASRTSARFHILPTAHIEEMDMILWNNIEVMVCD